MTRRNGTGWRFLLWLAALGTLAGCGGRAVVLRPSNAVFAITPGDTEIDTNCVGCNSTDVRGGAVERFRATLYKGGAADVVWSVSGGDANAGAGTITEDGVYTPPAFLTADQVQVAVRAALKADPMVEATARLTLTPGFQQPLTPQNATVPAGGSVQLTATLAEAGGGTAVRFRLAAGSGGAGTGVGSLGPVNCQRNAQAFTACTVTYTAPERATGGALAYVVAEAGHPLARMDAAVLVDAGGAASTPTMHQTQLASPAALGSSGGNAGDYDTRNGKVVDCCSGTLGALVEDAAGHKYILSNNHVLARSDQAKVGDQIVQPGMIDASCTPGAGATVGTLRSWLPLSAASTNADAALAEPAPNAMDGAGSILEFGARQASGLLGAAPPGISSTGGRGEPARLDLRVAKSGRTTGLTCGGVTAIDVDVAVDYFRDCAETRSYRTKMFTHQIGLSGNRLSDAGDSGALVVDAANAEPVGLYFAGGRDVAGVAQGMATPSGEVLAELGAQQGTSFTYVGAADHAVQCLDYGNATVTQAQAWALSRTQIARVRQALQAGKQLVNPAAGVLGVSMGKSSDRPGEAALLVYLAAGSTTLIPQTVAGVRTMVVTSDAQAVARGSAPLANAATGALPLPGQVIDHAVEIKRRTARGLMESTTAIFGIGVGQSLDNPREAALVLYVDRRRAVGELPQTLNGLRTRVIVMDRLHVTRSYATPGSLPDRCTASPVSSVQ